MIIARYVNLLFHKWDYITCGPSTIIVKGKFSIPEMKEALLLSQIIKCADYNHWNSLYYYSSKPSEIRKWKKSVFNYLFIGFSVIWTPFRVISRLPAITGGGRPQAYEYWNIHM